MAEVKVSLGNAMCPYGAPRIRVQEADDEVLGRAVIPSLAAWSAKTKCRRRGCTPQKGDAEARQGAQCRSGARKKSGHLEIL